MSAEQEVTAAFLARLDGPRRSRLAAWEGRLAGLLGTARSAWPGFSVPPESFLGWLVDRLPASNPSTGAGQDGADGLKVADLYLAFACAQGDPGALRIFEQQYARELDSALQRLRLPDTQREELGQVLRQKLLVAEAGAEPRIATYGGRGDLRRWLKAVAMREGLSLLRKDTPEVGMDEGFFDVFPTAAEDLELQHARREYQVEFKRAFEEALGTLAPEDRNLLRRHFIDGVTTPQLAALHGTHRVTMFRRLKQVCETLAEHTRKLLLERLPMTTVELASLNRLVRSQLDMSLERLLPPARSGEFQRKPPEGED